jgi:hypothetical protein
MAGFKVNRNKLSPKNDYKPIPWESHLALILFWSSLGLLGEKMPSRSFLPKRLFIKQV